MRNTLNRARRVVPCILFTLAGCFSLGRKTPVLEQYVLGGALVQANATEAQDQPGHTIGLRRLDLAAYLATPAIVVRRGSHRIVTSEFHRWGEDVAHGISRAFARHLVAEARVRAVDIAPWPIRSRHDYLIQLHISRLEGTAPEEPSATEGEAHVAGTWEIIRPDDGALLARGATDHREPGWKVGDYAGLVNLLNKGVNAMARDLDACLGRLAPVMAHTNGGVVPSPAVGPALACAGPSNQSAVR